MSSLLARSCLRLAAAASPRAPPGLQRARSLLRPRRPDAALGAAAAGRQQQVRRHGGAHVAADAPTVRLTFAGGGGDGEVDSVTVEARVGENLLQVAHRCHIDLEGACEGVCACATCHVVLPGELYDALADPEDLDQEPSEDEEDMLDMAFGLTDTSRLGCQVNVTEGMDGMRIELPSATRNFYVDGHVPQPH